jgi:hypothetical protein
MTKQELAERFESCKDGEVFEVEGKRYMRITGMILECLDTSELLMKSIDF